MQLAFHVARFSRAVLESHVLQFAFATGIAHRTIQRMITQQKLDHGFAGLADFIGFGGNHHSVSDLDGAGGLQLRHLLNAHQTHAAGSLEREAGIIAE